MSTAIGTIEYEFPDYDPAWLPKIPDDWKPTHWHNNIAPSWEPIDGLEVFIDYPAEHARLREGKTGETPRYMLVEQDPLYTVDGIVFRTDRFEALLNALDHEDFADIIAANLDPAA